MKQLIAAINKNRRFVHIIQPFMNVLKFKWLAALLFVLPFSVLSQSVTLKGVVYAKKGGESLDGVSVYVVETKQSLSTDENGIFTIAQVPQGNYTINFYILGFRKHVEKVTVKGSSHPSLTIYMEKDDDTELPEVVVNDEIQDKKNNVRISITKVTPKLIKGVPGVGGEPDIATYLQTLPGVVTTGDQGGQLYVRGGAPIQNKVLMDGMIIYNPFHSIGFYSVFDTDIIKGADVYTGGYNAEHGGRISSVIDITTRDGNKSKFSGKVSANPFGAKALLEGPIGKRKKEGNASMSYLVSGRTSYLAQSSKLLYKYINDSEGLPFNFTDLYGKFSANSGTGSKFNLFGFNFNDSVTYKSISKLKWNSYGAGTNFVMLLPGSPIQTEGHLAYSKYEISLDDKTNPLRTSSVSGFNGGFDFKYFLKRDEVRYGVEVIGYATDFITYNSVQREIRQNENTTEIAAYVVYKLTRGRFLIEPGFRAHYYASLRNFSPEPRLGFKFNATEKFRIKGAAGIYSQNLIAANSDRDVVNLFYGFLSGTSNLPSTFTTENGEEVERVHSLQKANHYIFGFEYDFTDDFGINLEGYLKDFTQLTNMNRNKLYDDDGTNTHPDIFKKDFIIETGKAYGVDFSMKYSNKTGTYIWFVYSLGKVTRWDGLISYNPVWDRRHNINMVFTQVFDKEGKWEANARWNFGTGLPFSQTQGYYASITQSSISGNPYNYNPTELSYVYSSLNTGRLPTYHRLDISVKRRFLFETKTIDPETGKEEKKLRSEIETVLGVTNAYNRANVFYVERSTQEVVNQLPFIPTLGINWSF